MYQVEKKLCREVILYLLLETGTQGAVREELARQRLSLQFISPLTK